MNRWFGFDVVMQFLITVMLGISTYYQYSLSEFGKAVVLSCMTGICMMNTIFLIIFKLMVKKVEEDRKKLIEKHLEDLKNVIQTFYSPKLEEPKK